MFNPENYLAKKAEKTAAQEADPQHYKCLTNRRYLDQLTEKAAQVSRLDRINPLEFADLYGENQVRADISQAQEWRQRYQENDTDQELWRKKTADVLEAILHQQIELNDYFGERVNTIKTCDFDDINNGVDTLLEIQHPEQKSANYSGIALDVTSAKRPEILDRKIKRILEKIQNGQLAKIKYFKSNHLHLRGEKSNIPLFVIGCDLKHTEELARLWFDGQQGALARHPIQVVLIKQIIHQATQFRDFAKSHHQGMIAEIYNQILEDFLAIEEERQETIQKISTDPKNQEFIQEDLVLNTLSTIVEKYV